MACDGFDEAGSFHNEAGFWSTVKLMQPICEKGASGLGITMANTTIPCPFVLV